jgi:hypothetical protein
VLSRAVRYWLLAYLTQSGGEGGVAAVAVRGLLGAKL